jgi:hypothetical protein
VGAGSAGSMPGGSATHSMGTGSGMSGADSSLRGIAAAGGNDPAYQQVYRDCLKRRGF